MIRRTRVLAFACRLLTPSDAGLQILGNVLPGFRDVRTPLVAGYLWLVFAWIVLRPDIHHRPADPVFRSLFELGHDVGRPGIALATSVGAYLLGAASQGVSDSITRSVTSVAWRGAAPPRVSRLVATLLTRSRSLPETIQRRLHRSRLTRWALQDQVSSAPLRIARALSRALDATEEATGSAFASVDTSRGSALRRLRKDLDSQVNHRAEVAAAEAERELSLPATLLVGEKPELFAEVDRLRAEGELRTTVIPPLAAICVAMGFYESTWWVASLALLALLYAQGAGKLRDSRKVIADAIGQRVIESASQADFEAWTETFIKQTLPATIESAMRFRVERATWGPDVDRSTTAPVADVTDVVQDLVTPDGTLNFLATSETLGTDPAPGVPKELVIGWAMAGATHVTKFLENARVTLPHA